VTPENQFLDGEFGPTRIDERHRIVASGVVELPYGFQVAPILQFATARPYSPIASADLDGDGRSTIDRICASGNSFALGCTQVEVNNLRSGFVGSDKRRGDYFNVDLRVTKAFSVGERFKIKAYANFFNLFNYENISFANRFGFANATAGNFRQPVSLFGPGFGPPVGIPFTFQLGARVDF
jgi:hypothetical protein